MRTIGVAVAIPEPWASELQDYRVALGDPTAGTIPTHITLLPPTKVDDDELALIGEHLDAVAGSLPGFEVHLRGTATFRPVSPVVFVSLAAGISECERLAEAVRGGSGPLSTDLEFPYHPHVTIAHHLDDVTLDRAFDDLAGFECRFGVTGFHLYVHEVDHGWEPAREFRLATNDEAR